MQKVVKHRQARGRDFIQRTPSPNTLCKKVLGRVTAGCLGEDITNEQVSIFVSFCKKVDGACKLVWHRLDAQGYIGRHLQQEAASAPFSGAQKPYACYQDQVFKDCVAEITRISARHSYLLDHDGSISD